MNENASGTGDLRARERHLRRLGFALVAGADEAGAGPLAGPLVAAAVILPSGVRFPRVRDSKTIPEQEREELALVVRERALAFALAESSLEELERVGPFKGACRALRRALLALTPAPDYAIVDARRLEGLPFPHESPLRADGRHRCVAAASVLAKVHRDALMRELDVRHPGYGFAEHKGYATPAHLEALERLGPSPVHRRAYAPVRRLLERQRPLFEPGRAPASLGPVADEGH